MKLCCGSLAESRNQYPYWNPIPSHLTWTRLIDFVNERTRLIILNSPSNPTGGVMPLKDMQHVAEAAQRYDCWVLTDEIYNQIVFDGIRVTSIASLPGNGRANNHF